MRHHGATVVGGGLQELVSRAIFLCQNADYQLRASLLGPPAPLRRGEVKLAGAVNAMPSVVARTWEYWRARLAGERLLAAAIVKQTPHQTMTLLHRWIVPRGNERPIGTLTQC